MIKNNDDEISKILEISIKNNLIVPYYQPIVNNISQKVEKYEALMRINFNNRVLIPKDFMRYSIENGIYPVLSLQMIQKIFNDVNIFNIKVSINLTMQDICNENITLKIYELLKKCKYTENITFEIVEIFHILDTDKFTKFANEIKNFNAKLSIDDFGSGYSNFEYFSKFDFDYIKIDGLFIKDILTNKKHQNIINSLLLLVKDTNIKLIAEFVENEFIFKKLKELGIHFSQGYYFGKAIPIKEIKEVI